MSKNVLIALQVLILGALVVPGKRTEASVSAACQLVINNSVTSFVDPTDRSRIDAFFTPNGGYSRVQAANYCGVTDFDWVQIVTSNPLPTTVRTNNGTLLIPPFNDPPPGGYTYQEYPDNAYPYYYDPKINFSTPQFFDFSKGKFTELSSMENEKSLFFTDRPGNSCFLGGVGSPLCDGKSAPLGSKIAFSTHLVGVLPDYSIQWLGGIGFNWTSSNNGLYGGIAFAKNSDSFDDGSDIDAITITGEQKTFDEAFTEAFKAVKIPESSVFGIPSIPSLLLMFFICKRKKPLNAI